MIILSTFFLILLILISAAWFIIPFYMFITELYDDITRSLRRGKRFPFGATIGFALGLVVVFFIAAITVFIFSFELYFLWNPEKRPKEPEKPRKVELVIPGDAKMNAEIIRQDDKILIKNL